MRLITPENSTHLSNAKLMEVFNANPEALSLDLLTILMQAAIMADKPCKARSLRKEILRRCPAPVTLTPSERFNGYNDLSEHDWMCDDHWVHEAVRDELFGYGNDDWM